MDAIPIDSIDVTECQSSDVEDDTNLNLPTSLYPPHYTLHISFWISDELSDILLSKIISESVGKYVLSWRTIDSYTSACGRQSQTVELEYCDKVRALGHTRVLHLQTQVLGLSLVRCAGVELR